MVMNVFGVRLHQPMLKCTCITYIIKIVYKILYTMCVFFVNGFIHNLIPPPFIFYLMDRHSTCQILQLSVICLSQWELRQRKGNRCSYRDTKKLRTMKVKLSRQLLTFLSSHFCFLIYLLSNILCVRFKPVHSLGDLSARCHYCTHYSSAIIVASFLVRMEPFSHTFQALQVRPLIPGNIKIHPDKPMVFLCS